MAVLDGMRAVKKFRPTFGLKGSNPMAVGYGYSGGAIASGWAAALQPTYAPELNVKGWVAGGLPTNLSAVVDFIDNTAFSGFLPAVIAGLAKDSAYGAQLNLVFDRIITPRGREVIDFADSHCAVRDIFNFPDMSVLSTDVQSLGDQLLYEPTVAKVLSDTVLGVNATEVLRAPVLV